MPTDPSVSAATAIAAHFAANVTYTFDGVAAALPTVVGWPEFNEDHDISAAPVVSITPISDQASYHPPYTIDAAATVNWKVADLTMVMQVDLWAPYKSLRDTLSEALGVAFHNDIPHRSGLYLTHADYYDRPITARFSEERRWGSDAMTPSRAHWRSMWTCRVMSAKIIQAATPQQLQWTLRQIVDDELLPDSTTSAP